MMMMDKNSAAKIQEWHAFLLFCDEFDTRSERVSQREKSREVSQLRWIIGNLAAQEAVTG